MMTKIRSRSSALLLIILSALGISRCGAAPPPLDQAAFDALYQSPLKAPSGSMKIFHLGHSLVGRDMPAMLQQLSPQGHQYDSQLGWGTSLKAHWGDAPINGPEKENAHPHFRDAGESADSGEYDAFVLTEAVEIRDSIKYNQSWDYLRKWTHRIWQGNTATRVYLYETWHPLDSPEGWLNRLDTDLGRYWENAILRPALAAKQPDEVIYVIPAGQVMASFVRRLEERGGVDGLKGKEDLFARDDKGELDTIHINDLGAYLVALTHYAVLYHRSPIGLPYKLRRADGSLAEAPGPEVARLMQETVWDVVTSYPKTGVKQNARSEPSND